jgi:tRNA(fMet)-specific endonuclease VapC
MGWLLDTNICSYALKKKPPEIARRLSSKTPGDVMVSTITVYELAAGCERSPARERILGEVTTFLAAFPKLVFSVEDAGSATAVRARLEKKGTPIGPYDLLLAGQALARNLTLVTNNTREFRRVKGLKLEDWSK